MYAYIHAYEHIYMYSTVTHHFQQWPYLYAHIHVSRYTPACLLNHVMPLHVQYYDTHVHTCSRICAHCFRIQRLHLLQYIYILCCSIYIYYIYIIYIYIGILYIYIYDGIYILCLLFQDPEASLVDNIYIPSYIYIIYQYIYIYIYIYIKSYIHTHIHTYMHTSTHIHNLVDNTHAHKYTQTNTHRRPLLTTLMHINAYKTRFMVYTCVCAHSQDPKP